MCSAKVIVRDFGSCGYKKGTFRQGRAGDMYEYDWQKYACPRRVDQHQRMTLDASIELFSGLQFFSSIWVWGLKYPERTQSNVGAAVMEDGCGPLAMYG